MIYIYSTSPDSKLTFKTRVEQINLSFSQIRDDKKYWRDLDKYEESKSKKFSRLRLIDRLEHYDINLKDLLKNGLKGAPQGPVRINDMLLVYIDGLIGSHKNIENKIEDVNKYLEGEEQTILITTFERNFEARKICLDYHGYTCKICGFNFQEKYGSIGEEFIHVHHIAPLSQIKESYVIDPIKDLIPVCPNCHAMLHRKKRPGGKYLTPEQLILFLEYKKTNRFSEDLRDKLVSYLGEEWTERLETNELATEYI